MARASNSAVLPPKSKIHKGAGTKKFGRNRRKCEAYRRRVGKPNGPGQAGQHSH